MKKFRGFIFHSASLLSALLLSVALFAWAHGRRELTSYDRARNWIDGDPRTNSSRLVVVSGEGQLLLYRARFASSEPRYLRHFERALAQEAAGGRFFARSDALGPPKPGTPRLRGMNNDTYGFGWRTWSMVRKSSRTTYFAAQAPYWALSIALAVQPAAWLVRWRASRRIPPGCCRGCGYDLRASPERCPECGRTVAQTA